MNKRTEMIRFATEKHQGQFRKFGLETVPYIVHPIEVSIRVALVPGATEAMVLAAIAHDLLEDTLTTRDEIVERFGETVASLVVELTDHFDAESHPDFNRRERKAMENHRQATMSSEAKVIKLADVENNLRNMIPSDKAEAGEIEGGVTSFGELFLKEKDNILEAIGDADALLKVEVLAASEGLAGRIKIAKDARKARKA